MDGKKGSAKIRKVKKHFKVKQYKKGFTIYTKDDLLNPGQLMPSLKAKKVQCKLQKNTVWA